MPEELRDATRRLRFVRFVGEWGCVPEGRLPPRGDFGLDRPRAVRVDVVGLVGVVTLLPLRAVPVAVLTPGHTHTGHPHMSCNH